MIMTKDTKIQRYKKTKIQNTHTKIGLNENPFHQAQGTDEKDPNQETREITGRAGRSDLPAAPVMGRQMATG